LSRGKGAGERNLMFYAESGERARGKKNKDGGVTQKGKGELGGVTDKSAINEGKE